jgi:MFS family permease
MQRFPLFYGWVIVGISLLAMTVSYGIRTSFPVFFLPILKEFGWSRADTALIYSINIVVYGISAPITGMAIDRLGPQKFMGIGAILLAIATASCSFAKEIWHFCILFGVLVSFGVSANGWVPGATLTSHWFIKRRGAILGILGLGFGFAYMLAFGIEYLIEMIGWRSSFVALGLLAAGLVPLIVIFQRLDPKEKGLLPDGEPKKTSIEGANRITVEALVVDERWASRNWNLSGAIKTYRFWLLFMSFLFLLGVAYSTMATHLVVFAVDQGYSAAFGAFILSFYGLFVAAGYLLGFLSDRFGREIMITAGIMLNILGVLMLILNRGNHTFEFMYAYGVLFGMGNGMACPGLAAALADIFQGVNFGSIMGLVTVGTGIGGAIGPWLGGKIFDMEGTYILVFYSMIVVLIACIVFVWVASPRKVRRVVGKVPKVTRSSS